MWIYLQLLDDAADRSKFERLYHRYALSMLELAFRLLQNEPDAEDAVHQAFLALTRCLGKLGAVESDATRAYVTLAVEHAAADLLRQRRRLLSLGEETEPESIPIHLPEEGGLAEAMAALPARYRSALVLRYAYGLSTAELAKQLGLKLETAQRLLTRAKTALRKKLNEEGIDV